jgi:hypothetical protein
VVEPAAYSNYEIIFWAKPPIHALCSVLLSLRFKPRNNVLFEDSGGLEIVGRLRFEILDGSE